MNRCSYTLCKTGLPGVVVPVATFLPKNPPPYMPRGHAFLSNLRLCEGCALTADVHQMVDNKRWKDITDQIIAQGGEPPDRDSLKLMLAAPQGEKFPRNIEAIFNQLERLNKESLS